MFPNPVANLPTVPAALPNPVINPLIGPRRPLAYPEITLNTLAVPSNIGSSTLPLVPSNLILLLIDTIKLPIEPIKPPTVWNLVPIEPIIGDNILSVLNIESIGAAILKIATPNGTEY